MGNKLWKSRDISEAKVSEIIAVNRLPRPAALFLLGRKVDSNDVSSYMSASLKNLSDPYRFPNIRDAAQRLWQAVNDREIIMIHGDYDTDGVTSTALLTSVIESNGGEVYPFLPHRFDDGYGFTPESLHKSLEQAGGIEKSRVLVTVDCGINSIEAIQEASRLGIDVIITDHHEPDHVICNEQPIAFINPKYHPELKDLNMLAGVGVAFKLAHAFIKYGRENDLGGFSTDLNDILDFVALGTVADIVALQGENRILVRHGMKVLRKQMRPGIRTLFDISRLKTPPRPSDITFKLAPRINASGRMGSAKTSLELLNSVNIVDAYKNAELIEKMNKQRQKTEADIYNEAVKRIEVEIDLDKASSIVVSGHNWHQGVIGIVASRLARNYHRPAIVLSITDGEGQGSGRSISNLNLVEILSDCPSELMGRFGGHPMAVGLSMDEENIPAFKKAFDEKVKKVLTLSDSEDYRLYDGEIELRDLDSQFFNILADFEPFGQGNEQPVYLIRDVSSPRLLPASKAHTHGTMRDRLGYEMDFIAFGKSPEDFPVSGLWDILVTPQLNDFYKTPKPQLHIIAVEPAGVYGY